MQVPMRMLLSNSWLCSCRIAFCTLLVQYATWPIPLYAESIVLTPESDWYSVLHGSGLQPGDEVVLRQGVYSDARRLELRHRGEPGNPVLIRVAAGESVLFRRPDAKQNTLNLTGCHHLILRGIEITGGASGIRIQSAGGEKTSNIVLEDLHIHHIGGVAVTCNHEGSRYEHMTFRRNHIHHTAGHGEGFYLGGNHASAVFFHSRIEHNYIHDLHGPKVSQGDGIEIKQGSYGNHIIGNVIHDTNYPGITVYGTQGKDRNTIQGNVIWKTGDHGIQAAADAVISGNWIASPSGSGIYSRAHQGAIPANLLIRQNVVITAGNPAIRLIGPSTSSHSIHLINNQIFSRPNTLAIRVDQLDSVRLQGNVGRGDVQGIRVDDQSWRTDRWSPETLPSPTGNPYWNGLPDSLWKPEFQITDR